MSEWIPCAERLPHDQQLCLISDGKRIALAQWEDWGGDREPRGWWDPVGGSGRDFEWDFNPTHWMMFTLPAPLPPHSTRTE